MAQIPLTVRRWKRVEYDRLVDLGAFEGEPLELIGGQDYWIANIPDGVLEVYRDPGPDSLAAYGWRYRSVVSLTRADVVVPLAFPSARIAVTDLLP